MNTLSANDLAEQCDGGWALTRLGLAQWQEHSGKHSSGSEGSQVSNAIAEGNGAYSNAVRQTVQPKREQKRHSGPRGEPDAFGNGLNTDAHRINLAMSRSGQSVQEIAARSGIDYLLRVQSHMQFLRQHGWAERADGGWRLTAGGLRRWNSGHPEVIPVAPLSAEEADETEPDIGEDFVFGDADHRELVERQIRERRGQSRFRNALRKRYRDRCIISGCEILAVLEAAHIKPYRGQPDHHPKNGLLLRTDLHTLFDLDLIGVEPNSLTVRVHPDLIAEYGEFEGVALRCRGSSRPSREALEFRYAGFLSRRRKRA